MEGEIDYEDDLYLAALLGKELLERNQALEQELSFLKDDNERQRRYTEHLFRQIGDLRESGEERVSILEQTLTEKQILVDDLKSEIRDYRRQLTSLQWNLEVLENKNTALESNIDALSQQNKSRSQSPYGFSSNSDLNYWFSRPRRHQSYDCLFTIDGISSTDYSKNYKDERDEKSIRPDYTTLLKKVRDAEMKTLCAERKAKDLESIITDFENERDDHLKLIENLRSQISSNQTLENELHHICNRYSQCSSHLSAMQSFNFKFDPLLLSEPSETDTTMNGSSHRLVELTSGHTLYTSIESHTNGSPFVKSEDLNLQHSESQRFTHLLDSFVGLLKPYMTGNNPASHLPKQVFNRASQTFPVSFRKKPWKQDEQNVKTSQMNSHRESRRILQNLQETLSNAVTIRPHKKFEKIF